MGHPGASKVFSEINIDNLDLTGVITYHKAAADFYHGSKDYSQAYGHYKKMHTARRKQNSFNENNRRLYRARLQKKLSTNLRMPEWSEINGTAKPIFIVGFPRSGTTLLDTFLRGHKQVEVIEEKPYLAQAISGYEKSSQQQDDLIDASKVYLAALSKHQKVKDSVLIDKLPLNLVELDYIYKMFPNALVICSLRHPLDCIWSCYTQLFSMNASMANFTDLQEAFEFYNEVFSLKNHVEISLNKKCYVYKYEHLVKNPEDTLRKIVKFLGIEFEQALLDHQKAAGERSFINTPSHWQVSKGLYKTAINASLPYRHILDNYAHLIKERLIENGYTYES